MNTNPIKKKQTASKKLQSKSASTAGTGTPQHKQHSNWLSIGLLVMCSWAIKLLLIPAYYSTDFAVHQNWLRITYSLPLSQWYYDTASKWTLDYPPLFAYFEYALSLIASWLSPSIVLTLNQLPQTVFFQRISVIASDLPYLYTLLLLFKHKICLPLVIAYLWIPFILLDNVHFQYNLMMQALLVMSVVDICNRRYLRGAFLYATLLNFKHIYLYCAPAFFVYLLKEYIFNAQHNQPQQQSQSQSQLHTDIRQQQKQSLAHQHQHEHEQINPKQYNKIRIYNNIRQHVQQESWIMKLIKTGAVTLLPFVVSFGPFVVVSGIEGVKQILARLFPFSRGLVHDYWAPNFWALYYTVDKLLAMLGFPPRILNQISATHPEKSTVNLLKILPEISPNLTILLILLFLLPIIVTYFLSKKHVPFPKLLCLCGFVFFVFGFHVHEKAITPYISLLFLFYYRHATDTRQQMQILGLNAAVFVNIVNLVPLLIQPKQKLLCLALTALWVVIWDHLQHSNRQRMLQIQQTIIKQLNMHRMLQIVPLYLQYLIQVSGIAIVIFYLYIHPILFNNKPSLQFLPLMVNSVWAAIFNIAWIGWMYLGFVHKYLVKGQQSNADELQPQTQTQI